MPSILTYPTYAKLGPDFSEWFVLQNPFEVIIEGTHPLKIVGDANIAYIANSSKYCK